MRVRLRQPVLVLEVRRDVRVVGLHGVGSVVLTLVAGPSSVVQHLQKMGLLVEVKLGFIGHGERRGEETRRGGMLARH